MQKADRRRRRRSRFSTLVSGDGDCFDVRVRSQVLLVTGTDTGVGKTVFTALLASALRRAGRRVAALKPIASGGREDARSLQKALDGTLTLDEINPWHFRAAMAPLLAARREQRRVTLAEVVAHVRSMGRRFEFVVLEGAGGLFSPLGEGFDSRDLMVKLRARVVIVATNRLGAVNHVLLTLAALPKRVARQAGVVLMDPARSNAITAGNVELLKELVPGNALLRLPWLGEHFHIGSAVKRAQVKELLTELICFVDC